MRKKLAVVALLACAWAAGRCPMRSAAQGSLRYTLALDELAESAQRLELRASGWRLLALARGAGLPPERLAFGLECPWAAAGPLAPRGLLRALADPLGYSPASEVFSEPTGFRLEGALRDSGSRRGLWLEPFPGSLGLFFLRKPPAWTREEGFFGEPGLVQAGSALTLRWPGTAGGSAEARALALLSLPPAPGPEPQLEDWLCDNPPFPGGALLHLGGSLRMQAATPRLACQVLAAASGGPLVPPGLLGLFRLETQGEAWQVTGLLGASSRDYRLPEGGLYAGAWAAGLRLEAQPLPVLQVAGSWRRRIDRPPPVPGRCLPGSEEGELAARWSCPLATGGRLETRAAAAARARYAADGDAEPSADADLELGFRGEPGRFELGLHGDWRREGIRLRGQLGGERRGFRLLAGAAGSTAGRRAASGFRWRPFGRLEVSGRDFLFWLSLGAEQGGGGLSLGWTAAQALWKSPTVSTSRCRR